MASPHQRGDLKDNLVKWDGDGKIGLALNTRAINIIWGGDGSKQRYWKRSMDGSSEVVELVGVSWLEITGKIPLHLFSPSTTYRLFVNLKLTSGSSGWDTHPVIFKLHLPGNNMMSKEVRLSKYLNRDWVDVPDGGLKFFVPEQNSGMLTFAIYEIECEDWKKGLIIKEVRFVPERNYGIFI